MLKEMHRTSEKLPIISSFTDDVLVQLRRDDFRRLDDGSWITTREITIHGNGDSQRLINANREFKRGELSFFGLDLATILDKFHS
ncbi:MAG: hypothetical protein H8E48_13945 [Chloroflexi bacterium]|nr:hypothetical protein [Chloroflexota bacterium]